LTEKEFYIYIVSTGEYSDYGVEFFAVHKKKFIPEEMQKMIDKAKENYVKTGKPTDDYAVEDSAFEDEFKKVLIAEGFQIVYAIGEFHLLSYSKMDDLRAFVPWRSAGIGANALRIHLG